MLIFVLYWISNFFMHSLEFCVYEIMLSNEKWFYSLFLFSYHLYLFLSFSDHNLILCWIEMVKVSILTLFLILKSKASRFLPLSVMIAVNLLSISIVVLRYIPSKQNCWEFLPWQHFEFSNILPVSIQMIPLYFPSFSECSLSHLLIWRCLSLQSTDKSPLIMVYNLLMYCWI